MSDLCNTFSSVQEKHVLAMKSEVIKNKKPLSLRTMKNTLKMYTTLSDRLKQAGIKESKPKCEGKGSKNKNIKTKKNYSKKIYSEDYMNNQNPSDRIKKLQKPLRNYVISHIKEPPPNDVSIEGNQNLSKDATAFPEDLSESVQDKTTIFVSLDFIEDCQKYKRKITKCNWHLKNQRKDVKNIFRNQGKQLDKKEGPQEFQEAKSLIDNALLHYANMETNLTAEKKEEDKKCVTEFFLENPNINDLISGKAGKGLADGSPRPQPFSNKTSSDDVAKIDQKYLQSLLSCIRCKDEKVPENGCKPSDDSQSQPEKKKKLTGKDFFERKVKSKELHDEYFSNVGDNEDKLMEAQNESKNVVESLHGGRISKRVVRDSTKSEEQIKLKKAKNLYNYNNSNVKNKNVTYSKPDINDDRKKRKPRNKFMKNNVNEFIETSFPSEVSKVADVKELWRRETQKKSDNSLTSHSSCTVPESDEFPRSKNLESYKLLKKLVGEEINNIANKSENKDKTRAIKAKENANLASLNKSERRKDIYKTSVSPLPDSSNGLKPNEKATPKRRLLMAECGEHNSVYEDKMQKSEKLGFLVQDIPKEANSKTKHLEEKAKPTGKLPSQVIENWSILNRLEQAFLGLGTPTFQKNTKDSSVPKGKHHPGNENSQIKESKNPQRGKDVFPKNHERESTNPISTNSKNPKETSAKITKAIEPENKLGISKEKQQSSKLKKSCKPESVRAGATKPSEGDENGLVQMKKKRQIRPDTSFPEKPESHNSKREKNEEELKHGPTSRTQMSQKSKIEKLSKNSEMQHHPKLNQIKISGDNLERKNTFNVISVTDASVPQRYKNCGLNGGNLENQRSQTNNQESKSDDVFLEELRNEPKLRGIGNEAGTKLPTPPKRLMKYPVKDKPPQMCQNLKGIDEKKCLKPSKLPKNRVNQEYKNEKPISVEQVPQHTLSKLKSNNNITNIRDNINNNHRIGDNSDNIDDDNNSNNKTLKKVVDKDGTNEKPPLAGQQVKNDSSNTQRERAVKKRSILSVHLSQTPRKLVKIKEKDNSDCTLENTQDYFNSVTKNQFKTSYPNVSVKNMGSYDENLRNQVANNSSELSITKTNGKLEISPRLTSSSVNSTLCYAEQDQDLEQGRGESKPSKPRPLWEQDISHYHTIVREIMSQYKRIDGFLKQTEHLTTLSDDSVSLATLTDVDNNSDNSFINSHIHNIHEYRKKIISEYTELPIFEYKSKLQRSQNGNLNSEGGRKNLSVVKDSKLDADLDIKDYQPNIQKVLDSQLYVDTERLARRNEPKVKFKEKKSSLQEILTRKNEKTLCGEDWKRSCSMPKTLSRNSPMVLLSTQTLSSVDKSLGSLTSTSMTCYSQETESESCREIAGK